MILGIKVLTVFPPIKYLQMFSWYTIPSVELLDMLRAGQSRFSSAAAHFKLELKCNIDLNNVVTKCFLSYSPTQMNKILPYLMVSWFISCFLTVCDVRPLHKSASEFPVLPEGGSGDYSQTGNGQWGSRTAQAPPFFYEVMSNTCSGI